MTDFTTGSINKTLSHLESILRYIAPGFVFMTVATIVELEMVSFGCIPMKYKAWAFVGSGALIGLTIYGVHTNFLVPIIVWRFAVWVCKLIFRKHIPENYQGLWNSGESMYQLTKRRWLNRAPKDKDSNHLQAQLDKWGAMLNYLYCSGYAFLLVFALRWYQEGLKWDWLFWIGLALVFFGWLSDVRITLYEFRFWKDENT